jgi:hypothetical protein
LGGHAFGNSSLKNIQMVHGLVYRELGPDPEYSSLGMFMGMFVGMFMGLFLSCIGGLGKNKNTVGD